MPLPTGLCRGDAGGASGEEGRSSGEQLQGLVDARDWQAAISFAQRGDEDKAPPNWLLTAAVEDLASSTASAGQGAGAYSARQPLDDSQARDLSWEWCMRISDKAAVAELGLKHLRESVINCMSLSLS